MIGKICEHSRYLGGFKMLCLDVQNGIEPHVDNQSCCQHGDITAILLRHIETGLSLFSFKERSLSKVSF